MSVLFTQSVGPTRVNKGFLFPIQNVFAHLLFLSLQLRMDNSQVVWIASCPDTSFRERRTVRDTQKVFKERLCNLNRSAQTKAILEECERQQLGIDDLPSDHVLGVAFVKPTYLFDALQELAPEEKLQLDVFQRLHPADCGLHSSLCFFQAVEIAELPASMAVQRVGTRKPRNFFSLLQEGQLERLLEILQGAGRPLPGWLTQGMAQNLASFIVLLPKPIALLLVRGSWSKFCVCDMSSSLFKGWGSGACPAVWRRDQFPDARLPPPAVENIVEPHTASKFTDQLQHIFRCFIEGGAADEEASENLLNEMHVIAASLRRHSAAMQAAYGSEVAVLRAGQNTYNVSYLLHCFLLGDLLKADASLEDAVRHSCHIVLPTHIKDVVLGMLDDKKRPLPSPATISRLRLKVDVAWMMTVRKKIADMMREGIVVNCMADSSPQGGHDYELVHLTVLHRPDLAQLHVDILALERRATLDLEERLETIAEELELMQRIEKCCHFFTPPPVRLGVGKNRSRLGFKFHATMHALYLMAGPSDNLDKFMSSICTWVSDLGTEAGFSHIQKVPFQTLMPYIAESEQQARPEAQLEVDFAADRGDPASAVPCLSCEQSVGIPGILHILHNCFLGLETSMQHFSDAVGHLKHVAALLGQSESKERLLKTCFSDPIGEALAADIKQFSGHVYEERWGTVSACVLQLVECEKSLRRTWNVERFLNCNADGRSGSFGTSGEPGAKVDSVNVESVDAAICDPFFWSYMRMLAQLAGLQIRLITWAESCPCHWGLLDVRGAEIPPELRKLADACPMRGRRAADLASGEFVSVLREFLVRFICTLA